MFLVKRILFIRSSMIGKNDQTQPIMPIENLNQASMRHCISSDAREHGARQNKETFGFRHGQDVFHNMYFEIGSKVSLQVDPNRKRVRPAVR